MAPSALMHSIPAIVYLGPLGISMNSLDLVGLLAPRSRPSCSFHRFRRRADERRQLRPAIGIGVGLRLGDVDREQSRAASGKDVTIYEPQRPRIHAAPRNHRVPVARSASAIGGTRRRDRGERPPRRTQLRSSAPSVRVGRWAASVVVRSTSSERARLSARQPWRYADRRLGKVPPSLDRGWGSRWSPIAARPRRRQCYPYLSFK